MQRIYQRRYVVRLYDLEKFAPTLFFRDETIMFVIFNSQHIAVQPVASGNAARSNPPGMKKGEILHGNRVTGLIISELAFRGRGAKPYLILGRVPLGKMKGPAVALCGLPGKKLAIVVTNIAIKDMCPLARFAMQLIALACSRALDSDGINTAIRTAMTAITTSSSIKVKPLRFFMLLAPAI